MNSLLPFLVVTLSVGLARAESNHCCGSKKFFARALVVASTMKDGAATLSQNSFAIDQDYDRRLQRVVGTIYVETDQGGQWTNYSMIRDFNTETIYNFDETTCQKVPLGDAILLDDCVPGSFVHSGVSKLGSGNENVDVNIWVGRIENEQWTLSTTVNGCVMVGYTRLGTQADGSRVTESCLLSDFVGGMISSESALSLPPHCQNL